MTHYYIVKTGTATTDVELVQSESFSHPPVGWSVGFHRDELADAEAELRNHIAFSQKFWDDKVAIAADPATVRIRGRHYQIEPDTRHGMKGFGGYEHRIRFTDGREVVSHNLWTQGEIPSDYLDRLPDNAEFVGSAMEVVS